MAGLLDEKLRKVVIYVFLMVLGRLRIKKDLQEQGNEREEARERVVSS